MRLLTLGNELGEWKGRTVKRKEEKKEERSKGKKRRNEEDRKGSHE